LNFSVVSKTLHEAEMKFLVLIAVAFLATANGRFVQDELVPTRWMDRIIPDDATGRIVGGEPGMT